MPAGPSAADWDFELSSGRSPFLYFVLVFALSLPFWILGAIAPAELLPGLPVGALMVVTPGFAAAILLYREEKGAGVAALLGRALDFRRIRPVWYLPTLLLMPFLTVISYLVLRETGSRLPEPEIQPAPALFLFLVFALLGFAEEAGWSGYATDPLQERWGSLTAALAIGLVWAAWHTVPLLQAHRPLGWIGWWGVGTIASRVIIVWLYNNTGKSVMAASLYHAMTNLCWQLFPNRGSHYDPRTTALLLIPSAALLTLLWGPRRPQREPTG